MGNASKAKNRWKVEAERRASGIDESRGDDEEETSENAENPRMWRDVQEKSIRDQRIGQPCSKLKNVDGENRLEKQIIEKEQIQKRLTSIPRKLLPRPAPKQLKVKNHPMYKSFGDHHRIHHRTRWFEQRMRDANLDVELHGKWQNQRERSWTN